MSQTPVSVVDGNLSYDFRYAEAYQEGHKEIGEGMYAMIAGNANPKDTELTSYFIQDIDLSGDVSVKDKEILFNNMGLISTVPQ